ncbi:SDR family oxidoreductase [Pseudoroseicyclus tamaricis]|uniref:SDR family oxidoreductase n=1 Tax=Pseudoroseicyclus tamaricis TaxID=2705421 RepID=A0A6B2K0Z0_9RHOB|nr:SDR family NAD(P)-dependent oxidoreductase [Pseudoroseicyclus tamaricis]NDV02104.1 SDR family oxidoreductase [Pseudoroseicyclus tamaricis]
MELGGKCVVITGASRGIGAEAARAFAGAGARVALLARGEAEIAELAGEIGSEQALAVPCDVSRSWEVDFAVKAAVEAFGPPAVVIGNAAVVSPIAPIAEADPEAWGQAMDVNVKGLFHTARAALPSMLGAGGGTFLTLSSGAAHRPLDHWSAYCTSKAAAAMFNAALHEEYGQRGLRALALSPGTVATDMQRQIKESGIGPVAALDWSEHIPPDWPAKALLWMCSPDSDAHLGGEVSLRDESIRAAIGLG